MMINPRDGGRESNKSRQRNAAKHRDQNDRFI
jgi:hypothetical protein